MTQNRKPLILMVEDNAADIQLFRLALEQAAIDCELLVLRDGGEALSWIREYGRSEPQPHPDIAVIDLNLPKNDGIEILTAMEGNVRLRGLPSLVLSSSPSPRDVARVSTFANAAYARKPSHLDQYAELGQRVKLMLEQRTGRGASTGV